MDRLTSNLITHLLNITLPKMPTLVQEQSPRGQSPGQRTPPPSQGSWSNENNVDVMTRMHMVMNWTEDMRDGYVHLPRHTRWCRCVRKRYNHEKCYRVQNNIPSDTWGRCWSCDNTISASQCPKCLVTDQCMLWEYQHGSWVKMWIGWKLRY